MPDSPAKPRIAPGADHAGFPKRQYESSRKGRLPLDDVEPVGGIRGLSGLWKAVGERVANRPADQRIAVCGTGIGISIAANKVPKIRAAAARDVNTARLAREHKDANVLDMGGRVVNGKQAMEMVQTFLNTAFLGGQQLSRPEKIGLIEWEERQKS